jgi:hypothetical protein
LMRSPLISKKLLVLMNQLPFPNHLKSSLIPCNLLSAILLSYRLRLKTEHSKIFNFPIILSSSNSENDWMEAQFSQLIDDDKKGVSEYEYLSLMMNHRRTFLSSLIIRTMLFVPSSLVTRP